MEVRFENREPLRVAYVRHIGPYMECGKAWQTLFAQAGQQGLIGADALRIGIGHDNPDVTPAEKLRYDACLTVGNQAQPSGELTGQGDSRRRVCHCHAPRLLCRAAGRLPRDLPRLVARQRPRPAARALL